MHATAYPSKNIRTMLRFLIILATALCGTVAIAQEKSITLDTRPTGALVFLNGAEVGTTPFVYRYAKTPSSATTIELRMSGYGARSVDMLMVLKDQHARKRPILVNLYRDPPSERQRTDLPVVTMNVGIAPDNKDFGTLGTKKLQRKDRELVDLDYPDQLTSEVIGAMRNTFASATLARKSTQKGDEALRRAKVYLKPTIKSVRFDVDEFDDRFYGTVDVEMSWAFMSGVKTDSTLFTEERRTTCPIFMDPRSVTLGLALRDATRQLFDEEGLQDRLKSAFSEALVAGKGQVVDVVKPHPIVFSGRKDMLASLVKGVVTISTKDGHGSGFLISNDGHVVTNAHVVGTDGTVKVKFNQGFTLDGQVVKVNRDFDLALIKTPGSDMAALTLGDDAQLLIGEELFAIGTPLDEELGQTVTRGIISGRREFEGRVFLQTDVSINPGNSGGPLIDENGKAIGICTRKVQETGVEGIGFAVPTSKMLEMLNIRMVDR